MAYTTTNLSLFIFPLYLNGVIFNSILIIHPIVIFDHILIQIFLQFITGLVGYWLIIWIEHSLFNSYTLGITVIVKSH